MKEHTDPVLPTDSNERKEIPLFSGVLNYFPLALAAVARISKRGNDKHNPGQPLHWARSKSTDHPDCIARHLVDLETLNAAGEYEDAACLAWRALAILQQIEERRLGKAPSRGSRVEVKADAAPVAVVETTPVEARVERADVHTAASPSFEEPSQYKCTCKHRLENHHRNAGCLVTPGPDGRGFCPCLYRPAECGAV